jgi:hypothetical protein
MNHICCIAIAALSLLLLVKPLVYGQSTYSEFERGLQLSESQKAQAEETKRRYMGELQGLKQESINKRLELRELDSHPGSNPERRERLQRELGVIENSRQNLYNQYRSDVSRVLNHDQRERYNSFVNTERRRTGIDRSVTPPVYRPISPPSGRAMNQAPPGHSVSPPMSRGVNPPPPAAYRPMPPSVSPPMSRPAGPPMNRPMTPPSSRGHGR